MTSVHLLKKKLKKSRSGIDALSTKLVDGRRSTVDGRRSTVDTSLDLGTISGFSSNSDLTNVERKKRLNSAENRACGAFKSLLLRKQIYYR